MRLMQQCNEFSGFILTRRLTLDGEAVLRFVQVSVISLFGGAPSPLFEGVPGSRSCTL